MNALYELSLTLGERMSSFDGLPPRGEMGRPARYLSVSTLPEPCPNYFRFMRLTGRFADLLFEKARPALGHKARPQAGPGRGGTIELHATMTHNAWKELSRNCWFFCFSGSTPHSATGWQHLSETASSCRTVAPLIGQLLKFFNIFLN